MNIIQLEPNPSGSRPPIQTWSGPVPPAGYIEIPAGVDTSAMQTHMGFVTLTVEGGVVTAITGDDAAHQAYLESLPPEVPEPPTMDERVSSMEKAIERGLTLCLN